MDQTGWQRVAITGLVIAGAIGALAFGNPVIAASLIGTIAGANAESLIRRNGNGKSSGGE